MNGSRSAVHEFHAAPEDFRIETGLTLSMSFRTAELHRASRSLPRDAAAERQPLAIARRQALGHINFLYPEYRHGGAGLTMSAANLAAFDTALERSIGKPWATLEGDERCDGLYPEIRLDSSPGAVLTCHVNEHTQGIRVFGLQRIIPADPRALAGMPRSFEPDRATFGLPPCSNPEQVSWSLSGYPGLFVLGEDRITAAKCWWTLLVEVTPHERWFPKALFVRQRL